MSEAVRAFLLTLVLGLTCCLSAPTAPTLRDPRRSGIEERHIYFSARYDWAANVALDEAVFFWNETIGPGIDIKIVDRKFVPGDRNIDPDGIYIAWSDVGNPSEPELKDKTLLVLGWTTGVGKPFVWLVPPRIKTHAQLTEVLKHELGHVFGATDLDRTGGLMSSQNFTDRSCLIRKSAEEIAQFNGIPLDVMLFCENP